MNRSLRHLLILMVGLTLAALPALAGTVTGVVRNGTTGKVASGVEVTLLQLQNGMQPVITTKTDAQGRFKIDNALIGQQMMLLQAVFDGVDYHAPLPPGQPDANVKINVYEPTTDRSAFRVLHRIIALEPQGTSLMVGEEFDIENKTKPPKSYFRPKGSFEFQLPKGAQLNQVEAWGPSNMPVVQGTVGEGHNRYAIIFPFRPGNNGVRFSFKLDYSADQAMLRLPSIYPTMMSMLLAPPAVKVDAAGFSPAGSEHGWSVYSNQGSKPGTELAISVSGTGPPPSDNSGQGQSADAQGSESSGTGGPVAEALPPRLNSLRGILIGGFVALFVLGAFFLWWKSRNPIAVATPAGGTGTATVPTPQTVQQVGSGESSLRNSVDEIKETLFRLELRRQAGTLAESEYLVQRQRLEKALRDLVKG